MRRLTSEEYAKYVEENEQRFLYSPLCDTAFRDVGYGKDGKLFCRGRGYKEFRLSLLDEDFEKAQIFRIVMTEDEYNNFSDDTVVPELESNTGRAERVVMIGERNVEYKDSDGKVYPSYKDYCNAPDLDFDLVQVKLWSGERTPQNKSERLMMKEIKRAKRLGKHLEIYPE